MFVMDRFGLIVGILRRFSPLCAYNTVVWDMLVILGDDYNAVRFHSMMDHCGRIDTPGSLRELRTQ